MTGPGTVPLVRRRRRRIVFIALLATVGALVAIKLGGRGSRPVLPDPNGYDDIARAGSMIAGEWPNKGDVVGANLAALRTFLDQNRRAGDAARIGLARDCVVHFVDSQEGLAQQFEAEARFKDVARLFTAEGLVAASENRPGDASRSFLDAMKVGQALTQDGMLADAQMGWALQKMNADRLRKLRDVLNKDDLKATLRELESLDRRRVPVNAVVARWERWYRGAFGPFQRAMLGWSGTQANERVNQRVLARKARDQAERAVRFLMIELAIHAYREDKGTWPRSVDDLVPAYLASSPIDPGTGKTVDYPAKPSGELTDDLGSIARPDGEVTPRP